MANRHISRRPGEHTEVVSSWAMNILFFGVSRDLSGCSECDVTIDGVTTTDELWERLIDLYPELSRCRGISRLAVDMEYYADGATLPSDIREIAIIPPVAGG